MMVMVGRAVLPPLPRGRLAAWAGITAPLPHHTYTPATAMK